MKILVGWDDASEAELISLYLNAGDNECTVATDPETFTQHALQDDSWDVVLMVIALPDIETAYEIFQKIHTSLPQCPIVGACKSENVFQLAKFITAGMRTYVLRDFGGDFVFLLQTTLESTVQAIEAEREQQIAERMREEIESVRRFQESAISTDLYTPPGYAIAGRYECSQIHVQGSDSVVLAGGDYYEVFPIDGNNAGVLIGDAAGHGMRACMSITIMQTLMQTLNPTRFRKSKDFVSEINRKFCEQKLVCRDGSLVTLLYGVLRFDRHEFRWTTAGHPMPILHNRLEGTVENIVNFDVAGPPLGVDPDFRYETVVTALPPGSRLLNYTDGLAEASPDEFVRRQFGADGIQQCLTGKNDRPIEEVVQALMDDSDEFTQGRGRHDDTSVLLLERL